MKRNIEFAKILFSVAGAGAFVVVLLIQVPPNGITDSASQISQPTPSILSSLNNLWVSVAFILVFLMQPGFALVEAGLIRNTNAVNVLFKNTIDVAVGGLAFFAVGYSLMWHAADIPTNTARGVFEIFWIGNTTKLQQQQGIDVISFLIFQLAFAMASATICSGVVAGRIQLWSYFVLTIVITAIVYPIGGYWAWADSGWLSLLGFHDFAGSAVVHAVGGFAGLAGAILLGRRIGVHDYKPDVADLNAEEKATFDEMYESGYRYGWNKPHNLPLATLGMFLLWIGWFGFNGGSLLGVTPADMSLSKGLSAIIAATLFAGCGGALGAAMASLTVTKSIVMGPARKLVKVDHQHTINGVLGGLVAVTASCNILPNIAWGFGIGIMAGVLVVIGVHFITSYLRIDDPVGAFSVHGLCGVFGSIFAGAFTGDLMIQLFGTLALCAWSFTVCFAVLYAAKLLGILRSDPLDEIIGLDRAYHGYSAYRIEEPEAGRYEGN